MIRSVPVDCSQTRPDKRTPPFFHRRSALSFSVMQSVEAKVLFDTYKAVSLEAKASNDTGQVRVTLHRLKELPEDPTNPEARASLHLSWFGTIPGEPSLWSETWHWKDEPPRKLERFVSRCPNRELLKTALDALEAKIPEDF